jgi:AcrR family transcriptional regulator
LRAATTTFKYFGIAKSTMDDTAKATGISRPTVYHYFRDRDTLIAALVEQRSRRSFERAVTFIQSRDTFADQLIDGPICHSSPHPAVARPPRRSHSVA